MDKVKFTIGIRLIQPPFKTVAQTSKPRPGQQIKRGVERVLITIQASKDDGKTWSHELLVYEGPSAYSSLARTTDGQVALLSDKDKDIVFATLTLNEVVR